MKRVEDNAHAVPEHLRGKTDPNVPPDQPLPLTGTSLHIFPQGDGAFGALLDKNGPPPDEAELEAIGVLAGGTAGGNPSVGFLIRLPDGRHVFTETTLRLLLTAVDAIKAVHGDPRT